jgi:hypothetical protein
MLTKQKKRTWNANTKIMEEKSGKKEEKSSWK